MPASDSLNALLATVQRNERTLRRFQDMELRLIGAGDSRTFFDSLFEHLPVEFALDTVTVWLDDNEPLLRDLLATAHLRTDTESNLKTGAETGLALSRLCVDRRPWLGLGHEMDALVRDAFFGDKTSPQSAIVLPLEAHDKVLGYLCLGSHDATRFDESLATDFLERFASIVAVSVDNVAHREQLRQLGITDPLTGLSNRRFFDERLHDEVRRATCYAAPVSCLFIDIDHFKRINDSHGHAIGDRALALIGACLRQHVRLVDTVSRYGGEEFVALLLCDLNDALAVAERIRKAVEAIELLDEDGERIPLTVSIGAAACQSNSGEGIVVNPDEVARLLMEEADQAMYKAKSDGRNRVALSHRAQ